MKSNTYQFAEIELSILSKSATDPENRPLIEPFTKEILALCEKFGKSGQSGGSAPFVATELSKAIKKLCLQEPISEITGIRDEWMNVHDKLYQNRRCYCLFKDGVRGKAYYGDAVIFKTQKGTTWFSGSGALLKNGSRIKSRQYIKGFPFTPKTFYIDVIEKEIAKDDWEFYIKDEKQLIPVFKYYSKSPKLNQK